MSWDLTWITVSCLETWVTIRQSGKTIYRIQNLYSSANPDPLFFLLILHLFLFLLHAHFCLCFDQEQTLVQQDQRGAGEEAITQGFRKESENNCILPLEAHKKFSVSRVTQRVDAEISCTVKTPCSCLPLHPLRCVTLSGLASEKRRQSSSPHPSDTNSLSGCWPWHSQHT